VNDIRLALAPASPLNAVDAEHLPTRVKLLGWGRNETSEGVVIVDDLTAKVFSANQHAIGRDRVAFDFEHNTVPGTPEYQRTTEPRAVAGHSALVCIPNEGIFAEAMTYTATGKKAAADFEDISLAPYLDKDRRVIGAHSFALTHTGATYGINFSQATLSAENSPLGSDLKVLSANQTPQSNTNMQIDLADLAEIVGLSASAEKPAVMAELKKRLTPANVDLTPLSARITTLESAKPVAGTADLAPLTARITALETKLIDAEKANMDAKCANLVTLFAAQGKVPKKADGTAYTADELKAQNLETLSLLLANTPVTVALSAHNAAHATESAKSFKDDKGRVDLAAIFDAEAKASGLTAQPNA
jgi:hypothetical protein